MSTHTQRHSDAAIPTGSGSLWAALGLDEPAGWEASALCAQTDPDTFFPEKGGSTTPAKRVCAACPVRAECLEEALQGRERFGIWGGLSERERRALLAERDRQAAA